MHNRRIRGDMIETYKILSGKYDSAAIPNLTRPTSPTLTTRGNAFCRRTLHTFPYRLWTFGIKFSLGPNC